MAIKTGVVVAKKSYTISFFIFADVITNVQVRDEDGNLEWLTSGLLDFPILAAVQEGDTIAYCYTDYLEYSELEYIEIVESATPSDAEADTNAAAA